MHTLRPIGTAICHVIKRFVTKKLLLLGCKFGYCGLDFPILLYYSCELFDNFCGCPLRAVLDLLLYYAEEEALPTGHFHLCSSWQWS
jgi:hypothetical protein